MMGPVIIKALNDNSGSLDILLLGMVIDWQSYDVNVYNLPPIISNVRYM